MLGRHGLASGTVDSPLFDDVHAIFPRFVQPVEDHRDREAQQAGLMREILMEAQARVLREQGAATEGQRHLRAV